MISSEEVAIVASKKKIDPERELQLREKSKHSKCKCHHMKLVSGVCMYRTCRHDYANHNKENLR